MTITPTKPVRFRLLTRLYAAYLRKRLDHAEDDARHAELQAAVFRKEAERLRCELAHRGSL